MATTLVTLTNRDPEFYPLLGPWLARKEVHRRLGGVPWDDDGKTWVIALDADRRVAGFIGYISQQGMTLLESGFVADQDQEARTLLLLIRAAVKAVAPSPLRSTVRKHLEPVYVEAGFAVLDHTNGFAKLVHSGKQPAQKKAASGRVSR